MATTDIAKGEQVWSSVLVEVEVEVVEVVEDGKVVVTCELPLADHHELHLLQPGEQCQETGL